jgi:hypothetical protein
MSNVIIPENRVSVFASLSTLVLDKSRLAIVRPDNPPPGVAGYLFNIITDDAADLESDITDHYIEDNTAIQDHIALKPEVVSVRGLVAELSGLLPAEAKQSRSPDPLPLVPGFSPVLTPGAIQTNDQITYTKEVREAAVADADSLFGMYARTAPQQPNQTKQSYIFGYFYQLWKGRQLFSVETPWGIFNSMAIQSINTTQGGDSASVSEMQVTFKRVSIVRSITVNSSRLSGRAVSQQMQYAQNGVLGLPTYSATQTATKISSFQPPR